MKNFIIAVLVIALFFLFFRVAKAEAPERKEEVVVETDPLFEQIAKCESRHDLNAQNSKSSAAGEFQFVKKTWNGYAPKLWGNEWMNKVIKSKDNRELAWFVYTHYGTKDWEADKKSYDCWKSHIPLATHRNIY